MKRAVLISIGPKWCALISSGEKTLELRKTFPQAETPFTCYAYETQGKTDMPWMDEDGHMIFRGRGAVVLEFVCDGAERFDVPFPAYMDQTDTRLLKAACIRYEEAHAYLGHRSGYGWHISQLKVYDKPRQLTDFRQYNTECLRHGPDGVPMCEKGIQCQMCRVKRPPQSWMYVELGGQNDNHRTD